MKHIDYKIETLLREGFSMKTITSFNKNQINLLYEKVKKEPKEAVTKKTETKTVTTLTGDDAQKGVPVQNNSVVKQVPGGIEVIETEVTERSKSTQQQKIMGLALSVKRGDTSKSKVSKSVKDMANKMSEKDLEDFASTKHKGLPKKVKSKENVKKLEENILKLIEDYLPPHTTKGELLRTIKSIKR
jgi:hypothetical protein